MKQIKVLTINSNFIKHYETIDINDNPITDDFDAWRAIDAAETDLITALSLSNRYKYIMQSQTAACRDIFDNLKTLIMDYLKSRQEGSNNNSN